MLELNHLYNMDCMEGMARFPDNYFDLAIVDPEYGRGEHGGKDRSGWVTQRNGKKLWVQDGGYDNRGWDNAPVGKAYFDELFRVSQNQIIWGVNYYNQIFGPGRIIWDKANDGTAQSDAELAYNSMSDRVDIFRFMWRGMLQGKSEFDGTRAQGNKTLNEVRISPCQKPVALYRWLLRKYAQQGWRILETHGGSCSIGVACIQLGFDYFIFEKDLYMYQKAKERLLEESLLLRWDKVLV